MITCFVLALAKVQCFFEICKENGRKKERLPVSRVAKHNHLMIPKEP
jgi:hypothetical protein